MTNNSSGYDDDSDYKGDYSNDNDSGNDTMIVMMMIPVTAWLLAFEQSPVAPLYAVLLVPVDLLVSS